MIRSRAIWSFICGRVDDFPDLQKGLFGIMIHSLFTPSCSKQVLHFSVDDVMELALLLQLQLLVFVRDFVVLGLELCVSDGDGFGGSGEQFNPSECQFLGGRKLFQH
jgi:hypothetical protein